MRHVEHLFEQRRELGVGDQRARQPNPFVEAHQMRAGVAMDAPPLRFEDGAQIGAGRSLAIGAGDMEGARQAILRVAEARANLGDAFEPQNVAPRRERSEAIELRLDGGVGAVRVVGHVSVPKSLCHCEKSEEIQSG